MLVLKNFVNGNDQLCIYQSRLWWQYVRWHEARRRDAGEGVISIVQKKNNKELHENSGRGNEKERNEKTPFSGISSSELSLTP